MKNFVYVVAVGAMIVLPAIGQNFKVYPGSEIDATMESREISHATQDGLHVVQPAHIYTTEDPYEKVVEFYKKLGVEHPTPNIMGKNVNFTTFIFDGAQRMQDSKSWAIILRPYMGPVTTSGNEHQQEVRDVTVIKFYSKP
jgi:hypothetical protein